MPDENITLLILNGVKRVRSIKVNRKRIRFTIFTISFFAVLFLISVGLNVFMYVNNGYKFSLLPPQIRGSESGTKNEQTGALMGDELKAENSVVDKEDDTATSKATGQTEVPEKEDIFANDRDSAILEILNLEHNIKPNGIDLSVSFSISKKETSMDAVSGTFVIVVKTTGTKEPFLGYPEEVKLNPDGMVSDYKEGEGFGAKVITHKNGRILLTEKTASFEWYRIFIFTDDGLLLLQKTKLLNNNI